MAVFKPGNGRCGRRVATFRPLFRVTGRHGSWCGSLGDVNEHPDFQGAGAGRTAPPARPLSQDEQPAIKADLYAAVDALDLERSRGETGPKPRFDDDDW
jgi:hypothetical protein